MEVTPGHGVLRAPLSRRAEWPDEVARFVNDRWPSSQMTCPADSACIPLTTYLLDELRSRCEIPARPDRCGGYRRTANGSAITRESLGIWVGAHRELLIDDARTNPFGLGYVQRAVVPLLARIAGEVQACAVLDIGAASYGQMDAYDSSDALLFFFRLLGPDCDVHAFDLNTTALHRLQAIAANYDADAAARSFHTHAIAVSDVTGALRDIRAVPGLEAAANVWTIIDDPLVSSVVGEVPTTTLDAFTAAAGLASVLWAKVDVQGAEPHVLRGMRSLLVSQQIAAFAFEYTHHWQAPATLELIQQELSQYNYACYLVAADLQRGQSELVPISGSFWMEEFDICCSEPGQVAAARCVVNVVAVPGHSKWEAALLATASTLSRDGPPCAGVV